MSNLLSGIIGAVLGGVLAIVASIITMRQQRELTLATSAEDWRQAQLGASYAASAEILSDMLIIKQSMWDAREASDLKKNILPAVRVAAERILVHNAGSPIKIFALASTNSAR